MISELKSEQKIGLQSKNRMSQSMAVASMGEESKTGFANHAADSLLRSQKRTDSSKEPSFNDSIFADWEITGDQIALQRTVSLLRSNVDNNNNTSMHLN